VEKKENDHAGGVGNGKMGEWVMWQPIETAPKDGEVILLYDGDRIKWSVVSGAWRWDWPSPQWADKDGGLYAKPSHWMPLPEPPMQKWESA
jgi:hypothetical protein